jgi:copper chaperone CopZ
MLERRFEVENAGCPSCAERVHGALTALGIIDSITIDEEADSATVSMRTSEAVEEESVNSALAAASTGAGHDYRVRAGSWLKATS